MEPLFLTLDEVLEIHTRQIELYGGSDGVRDAGGLESAVVTPMATFGGEFLHATIPSMAAADLLHICQNHPFVDGNKRAADWDLDFNEDELVNLVLSVASGSMPKAVLTETFAARCRPAEVRGGDGD